MCFLTLPAQPWQWMATFITTTYTHVVPRMVSNAMTRFCVTTNTCMHVLVQQRLWDRWGAWKDVVAWSTWNSGLSVTISSLSRLCVCDEGARTYPPSCNELAAVLDTDLGLDCIVALRSTLLDLLRLQCVCVCERERERVDGHGDASCMDGLFHCAPSTSPLCFFIWRKCRFCISAFVSFDLSPPPKLNTPYNRRIYCFWLPGIVVVDWYK